MTKEGVFICKCQEKVVSLCCFFYHQLQKDTSFICFRVQSYKKYTTYAKKYKIFAKKFAYFKKM